MNDASTACGGAAKQRNGMSRKIQNRTRVAMLLADRLLALARRHPLCRWTTIGGQKPERNIVSMKTLAPVVVDAFNANVDMLSFDDAREQMGKTRNIGEEQVRDRTRWHI